MFVLNRKRIYIIILCLVISTITFKTKDMMKKNTVATVALPVNNKVIIIDAGHGGEDGGATTDNRNIRS